MDVKVRGLEQGDLDEADRILRMAFGTFLGLPDPLKMFGDGDYVRTRWRADRDAALAAELEGRLVGSNFAANWGSIGFFGPISVSPELWNRGVAKRLLEATMALFAKWGTVHAGLCTFPHSAKHAALYQKFGFWPRFLTAVMSKPVQPPAKPAVFAKFSQASEDEKRRWIAECRKLTNAIFEGLDVAIEIESVARQGLGETILVTEGSKLSGVAVCHMGVGTEAGTGEGIGGGLSGKETCYVKFGAVRPGPMAASDFAGLLDACEALAAERGVSCLAAGTNLARHETYRTMIGRGFRTDLQLLSMHQDNAPGYDRPGIFVLDDWR